jgi:hypothetical protein
MRRDFQHLVPLFKKESIRPVVPPQLDITLVKILGKLRAKRAF